MIRDAPGPLVAVRWYDACAMISVAMVCAAIYANSLHNPLLRDDQTLVLDDARATDPRFWPLIFTRPYWQDLAQDPIYRPLTTLSFLVNHTLTGSHPWGYRIVNVFFHAGVSVAVYLLSLRLGIHALGAWFGAMLFAVHAVHTEAVVTIVGRADMAVTLLLLSVICLFLGRIPVVDRGLLGCAAVVGLSTMALLSKESGFLVLPLVVCCLIWRWWAWDRHARLPQDRSRTAARQAGVALSVAAACAVVLSLRYAVLGRLHRPGASVLIIDNPLGHADLAARLITGIGLVGKYLNLLAWPHPLSCDYSYNQIPVVRTLTDGSVLVGLAWLAGIGVVLYLIRRAGQTRDWRLAVGLAGFFVITYSLISNTVIVIGTAFAERLIYLPSVAWSWGFGALFWRLARGTGRMWRAIIALPFVAVLIFNAGLTMRRNAQWHDGLTLWQQSVRACPNSNRCWSGLAKAYQEAGQLDKAVECMERALAIYDGYWGDHFMLGEQLAGLRRFEQAATEFRRALDLQRGPLRMMPMFCLGQCYAQLGQPDRAIRAYRQVLQIVPTHLAALNNLAYLLAAADPPLRDLESAAEHIERAMQFAPDNLVVLDTAAGVYMAQGRRDRAAQLISRALAVGDKRHPLYPRFQQRLEQLTTPTSAAATCPRTRNPSTMGSRGPLGGSSDK